MSRSLSLATAVLCAALVLLGGAHAALGQSADPSDPSAPGNPGTLGVQLKGSTIIRLEKNLFQAITEAGGKVRAGKPAKATKTGVKFKVVSLGAGLDGGYVLKHKGEMRISTRKRSLVIKSPAASIDITSGQGTLTATVGKRRYIAARLQVDLGGLEETGSGINAENIVLTMTEKLALDINKTLGTASFLEGSSFGKADVKVITEEE
ncbi:MAG: hypothetical protein JHC95_09255 [Solirubrobacteraceae bacterium]|nr:hypothetical protein [Solirubrobacteraceae bacterium]